MDGHYIHLLTNHFPIVGFIIGFLVLTAALLLHLREAKLVALAIIVFSTLISIPAYISGEEAEHKIEEYAGVSESSIEEHEEEAELAFILIEITGALAFISFLLTQSSHKLNVWSNRITWAMALVSIVLLVNVGKSGGEIRRSELRENNTQQNTSVDSTEHTEEH